MLEEPAATLQQKVSDALDPIGRITLPAVFQPATASGTTTTEKVPNLINTPERPPRKLKYGNFADVMTTVGGNLQKNVVANETESLTALD